MNDIIMSIITVLASLFIVILFILLGWYVVWKVFLSRFKFVRELLGKNDSGGTKEESGPPSSRTRARHKVRFD